MIKMIVEQKQFLINLLTSTSESTIDEDAL